MLPQMVLMLGGEVGFMIGLAHELAERGIMSCPARTVRQARSIIIRFQLTPDVVMIDCSIRGACSLVEKVADDFRKVKFIGIVSALHHCQQCATKLTGTLSDPEDTAPDRIPYCADLIQRLLGKHVHHSGHTTAT